MASSGNILVTGAGGFIGGTIVEILHLTGANNVVAGIHKWSSCARIGRFPIRMVKLDLLNETEIENALEGVSSIVHCAQGSRDVIVRGTINLMAAARDKGVQRVVHLSSIAVYGNATGEIDESCPYEYTGDEYGNAKIDAEKACFGFCEKGLPMVILRPSIVYGPYSTYWTIGILRQLAGGGLHGLGRMAEGQCNLLFVHDLFRAIMLALRRDGAVGEAFNINGPDIITWNEYFGLLAKGLGLAEPATRSVGAYLKSGLAEPVRIVGSYIRNRHMRAVKRVTARFDLAKKWMSRAEQKIRATPSLGDMALYGRKAHYKCRKAEDALGFVPKFSADEGIRITNEWIRNQGFPFIGNGAAAPPVLSVLREKCRPPLGAR